jgi:hypothetical protein
MVAAACSLLFMGCSPAGDGRVLSIEAVGIVKGQVYFDRNGNDTLDAGTDGLVNSVPVYLLVAGTGDTAGNVVTTGGAYRFAEVPVGEYRVVLSTAFLSDTAVLVSAAATDVQVRPGDSTVFDVGATWPHLSIADARQWPLGRRVFVEGVALNSRLTFADTTVSLQDFSGSIRLGEIIAPTILSGPFVGDTIRVRGTTSASRQGQPSLERDSVITLGVTFVPSARQLTTQEASTADLGQRDAALVVVNRAGVTDTATFLGDFKLTVDDGSGALDVILDRVVVPPFLPPLGPAPYVPGDTLNVVGILVPSGTGTWRLKPRATSDIVKQ